MNNEEMISEIETYLSHVIQKDFPLPKAIKMMYEEYKRQEDKEKNWNKIYDEDQNHINELNNKIFELEEKNNNVADRLEYYLIDNFAIMENPNKVKEEFEKLLSMLQEGNE